MAVQVPPPLFPPTTLTTGIGTLYSAPAQPNTTAVRNVRFRFANTATTAVAVIAYAVPSGGSAGTSNECVPSVSVAANSYLDVDMPALGAGGSYAAQATVSSAIVAEDLAAVIFT